MSRNALRCPVWAAGRCHAVRDGMGGTACLIRGNVRRYFQQHVLIKGAVDREVTAGEIALMLAAPDPEVLTVIGCGFSSSCKPVKGSGLHRPK